MIEIGESLGNRYHVARAPEELRSGVVFELSDRGGAVVLGQLLAELAATPAMVQEVRGDLTVVPAMPSILKPRDIALSAQNLPVGVLERPGLVRLRDRVATIDAERKKTLAATILRAVATLASDLAMIHQSGQVHGAISSSLLLCAAGDEVQGVVLSGFGVTSFARRLGRLAKEPSARGDLVDLLGALHDLFLVGGIQPDGGAAAKWTLLRHAAMHGEHPALASGNALATQLNEIASLPVGDDRPVRTSRTPTIAAPGRGRQSVPPAEAGAAQRRPATLPPASHRTAPPGRRADGSSGTQRPPRRWRFSAGILVGGLAVIALLGSAAAYYIWDSRVPVSTGRLIQPRIRVARPACAGELTPISFEVPDVPHEFDAVCGDGRVLVVGRAGTRLYASQRAATRGGAFGEVTPVGAGVVELGSTLPAQDATWVSWRNGVGAPFGVARLDAAGATPHAIALDGWDNVTLRGATLLHVDGRVAWLLTTVVADAGSHAVLVQATLGEGARVATWFVAAGASVSATTGARPTVLVDVAREGRHALSAVTLDLAALPATGGRPTARGADLPAAAVTRSGALEVPGDALVGARHGAVGASGTRAFLVTVGDPAAAESCVDPFRCVRAGEVRVVAFPPAGAGRLVLVAERAWGEDLRFVEADRVEVLARPATPAGAPVDFRSAATVDLAADAPAAPRRLDAAGASLARAVACGTESWLVSEAPTGHRLVAAPTSCAERR